MKLFTEIAEKCPWRRKHYYATKNSAWVCRAKYLYTDSGKIIYALCDHEHNCAPYHFAKEIMRDDSDNAD